jgi:S-formylglutathione hydrolase FrmB
MDDLLGIALEQLGRLPRVVMGTSMGGYGAALLAQQDPKAFRGVIVSSGAIWRSPDYVAPGAFDGAADFAAHDVIAHAGELRGMPVRVDCGESDPFIQGNREFAQAAGAAASFAPGCHDRGFWRRVAPAQVAWAAGVLSSARVLAPAAR